MPEPDWPIRCGCGAQLFDVDDVRAHIVEHLEAYGRALAARARVAALADAARETVGERVPRGLLIRERQMCTLALDPFTLLRFADAEAEVRRQVDDRVIDSLIRYGADRGFEISRDSVWLTNYREYGPFERLLIEGSWSPDPMKGCELRGGAHDGEVVELYRGENGAPPRWYRIADDPLGWSGLTFIERPPVVTIGSVTTYERAGIDSMRDCWVYEAS